MEAFDEEALRRCLQRLAVWQRLAFLALIDTRMLSNYERFSTETGFGDVSVLRTAIDAAWTIVESGKLPNDLIALREACDRQAPNTEEFRSPYTSAALDAANAAAITLAALENPDESLVVEVASLSRDSVDIFVQSDINLDPNTSGFEEAILRHHLMQRELRNQREDLEALIKGSRDRDKTVRDLRVKSATRLGSLDN
jgi:uncharacterized protein YjaG (DUF416 family)